MSKRTLLVLAVLHFVAAVICFLLAFKPLAAEDDPCAMFDSFIGGVRFNYVVDAQGNWNFPDDAQLWSGVTFPKTGIEKYYSASQNESYVIVYLSWEPTQPDGARLGQHDICVWKLRGLGASGD